MAAISMNDEKPKIDEATYRKRIRSWALYDWANSAFATTILAALLPPYFSAVAGANLPSEATATAFWGLTLSISTFIAAILSPILGTISDIQRGKKKFLAIFTGIGVVGTGLLVFVSTGDWLLAALFFVIGRTGWGAALVFYDAILPHIASEEEQDKVSAQGFALGYLGGGILLAINVAMFTLMPNVPFEFGGIRLSFVSVALWWVIFSIPLFRDVPEPPSATERLQEGESIIKVSFARLGQTFRDLTQYRELFKYLIAFLIFNDPINTIIGMAAIYGAELGFGLTELVLALLLVQFVGIPFTLIFGNLPSKDEPRRHYYLAFVLFNVVLLPIVAITARFMLPIEITGNEPPPYVTEAEFLGQGVYPITDSAWTSRTVTGEEQTGEGFLGWLTTVFVGMPEEKVYYESAGTGNIHEFTFNGQNLELVYAIGPNYGTLEFLVDGQPLLDEEGAPVSINLSQDTLRYNESSKIELPEAGQHTITLVNNVAGSSVALASIEVLPPVRVNQLGIVVAALLVLQALGAAFAYFFGRFFKGLSEKLDTRTSILISIGIYCIIAVWGFFLNSTVEFWFLAWMVAIVQGGSQALSRSLYSVMSPSSKSGEFFGLFSILSKGAAVIGTAIFTGAVLLFGSSRPAILSLIALFVIGAFLLTRVDIEEGRRRAKEEDAQVYGNA